MARRATPSSPRPRGSPERRRAMKKIEAIIQPFKLEDVKEALKGIGIEGMTITEARGHGRQRGHKEVYRGMEYNVDLLQKVKVEMVVADTRAGEAIATLEAAARTSKIGDGKIFVFIVAPAIRIPNTKHAEAVLESGASIKPPLTASERLF